MALYAAVNASHADWLVIKRIGEWIGEGNVGAFTNLQQ
jgi:hypothetical protein